MQYDISLNPELLSDLQSTSRSWLKARVRRRHRKNSRPILAFVKGAALAIVSFHVLFFGWVTVLSIVYTFMFPSVTGFMTYRRFTDGTPIKPPIPVSAEHISRSTINMYLRLEDHHFYDHWGISPGAIREAMERNQKIGRMVFGGSTITQQLARNLFLNPERTFLRKYLEMGSTLIIEFILGKDRIMYLYLNSIEFGPGVFGIGQGARHHYKTEFQKLSYDQRARMAAIITSPLAYNVANFGKDAGIWARYRALVD